MPNYGPYDDIAVTVDNFVATVEIQRPPYNFVDYALVQQIADAFEALLEQLGPGSTTPDGTSMKMKIEARPGGRWYRDLGDDNGHHWALVQAIKRPSLLELTGPLFMSYPVNNNVQYRLEEEGGQTVLQLVHTAFGPIPDGAREGMPQGWADQLDRLVKKFS